MSTSRQYTLISRFENGNRDTNPKAKSPGRAWYSTYFMSIAIVCFSVSLLFNLYTLSHPAPKETSSRESLAFAETPYAHLKRDQAIKWERYSPFNSNNRTEEDDAWSKTPGFLAQNGIVALSDSYTEAVGLPTAQRWPWDESKGIYFVEGLHALHCVKYLRKAVYEISETQSLSMTIRHLKHCLDGLRQFVMCHADDTPRYTGRLHDQAHEEEPAGGVGQPRMCRDWSRLIDWTTANSACYRWVPDNTSGFTEAERYKSCPDGKVYW